MKKIFALFLCITMLLNLPALALTAGEPQIAHYGLISSNGNVITFLNGETSVRGYVDIVNPTYITANNIGTLTVECFADGVASSTQSVLLSIEQNTAVKRIVTDNIEVPQADSVVFKVYFTDSAGVQSNITEISYSAGIPGAENDEAKYEKAINLVKAFNLISGYEDGTFKGSYGVTRSEFAAILTRMLKAQQTAEALRGNTIYSDVNGSHWASGYINFVTDKKLMQGLETGTFSPDSNITAEQLVPAFVKMLGYDMPGYSFADYYFKAEEIGILNGVNIARSDLVSRGALAALVINSIDTPIREQALFGSTTSYVVYDGSNNTYKKTLMSEKLGIVKLKAFIQKSYAFESVAKENVVRTYIIDSYDSKYDDYDYKDNNTFEGNTWDINIGYTDLRSLVGYHTDIYITYKDAMSETPVAIYTEKHTPLKEVTISNHNIDYIERQNWTTIVDYYESDTSTNVKTATFTNETNIYINGYYANDIIADQALGNFYGKATFALMNYNSNADFDTIFISDYKNMVVDSVNMTTGRVLAKEGMIPSIIFNPSNTDFSSVLIDKDGKQLDWAELKENDILSVKKVVSSGRTISVCTLVRDTVTGVISEVNSNEMKTEFTIGDKAYKTDNQITYFQDLDLEDEGIFHLDIMGNITYVEIEKLTNYGYVLAVGESGTNNKSIQITILSYNNKILTPDTTSDVKLSHCDMYGYYQTETLSAHYILNLLQQGSIIVYDTDTNGKINTIILEDPSMQGNFDSKTFTKYAGPGFAKYDAGTSLFSINENMSSKSVYATENTIIMAAPPVRTEYNDDDYAVIPLSALPDGIRLEGVSAYDVNADKEAGLIVIRSQFDLTSPSDGLTIFKGYTESEDSNGNITKKYTVLQNGRETTLNTIDYFECNATFADVLIPCKNIHGLIDYADIIASVDNNNDCVTTNFFPFGYNEYTSGVVISKNSNTITTNDGFTFNIPDTANVYLYDERFGEVSVSSINSFDVKNVDGTNVYSSFGEGDLSSVSVLVREYDGNVKDVMLYFFGDIDSLTDTDLNICATADAAVSNVVYKNETDADENPTLVLARYKGGKLIGLAKNTLTVSKTKSGIFKCAITGPFDKDDTFKAILVRDLNSLEPIRISASDTVTEDRGTTDALTVPFDCIDDIQGQTIRYYNGTNYTQTLNLSTAVFYKNGILSDISQLSNFYGKAVFSSKNTDNSYNTVSISDYTNSVVDYVNTTTEKVVAKSGISIPYGNISLNSFAVLCDKDGNKMDWSVLNENDILSTKVVKKENITIYLSKRITDMVEGKITDASKDLPDINKEYTISDKRYKADYEHLGYFALEDEGTFYLDIMGRIAYFMAPKPPVKYAYVLDAVETAEVESTIQIKILTSYGEILVFDIESEVEVSYFDGNNYISDNFDSYQLLNSSKSYCIKPNNIIRYEVTTESKRIINKIILPDPTQTGWIDTDNFARYAYSDYASFDYDTKSFSVNGKRAYANDSTIIMIAPSVFVDQYGNVNYYEEDYEIVPLSRLTDDYELPKVSVYDVNDNAVANLIVIGGVVDLTSVSDGIAMVIRTLTTKNSDGDTVDKADVLRNGSRESLLGTEYIDFGLSLGDIIIPKFNKNNEVNDYIKLITIGYGNIQTTADFNYANNINQRVNYSFGKVTAKSRNRIALNNGQEIIIPSTANVYAYDQRGSKAETKIFIPDVGYSIFSIENGIIYDMDGEYLSSVYAFVRTLDGNVDDIVFYMFIN